MFTGIVSALGKVAARTPHEADMRLKFMTGDLALDDVAIGASIAVSGVCLTVVELNEDGFWADISGETLARTVLGDLGVGSAVNLEKALTLAERLGGHLVSGHVDGIGVVTRFYQDGRSWRLTIRAPRHLARYIAEKGSICVDGVSLTVNGVDSDSFDCNIVPHTLAATTIGGYFVGRRVNLEVDIIARYLERLLTEDSAPARALTERLLGARGQS
ncbi:MAG: riboflavin synthase [Gammaproteobacteria bacterium]